MTREEFGKWVNENRKWLNYKAEHWCCKIGKAHFEKEEVVSRAIYSVLTAKVSRIEEIPKDRMKDFMFICLRNAAYNSIIQDRYYANTCSNEGYQIWFSPSGKEEEEGDGEKLRMWKTNPMGRHEPSILNKLDSELLLKKWEKRAKTHNEKLVFSYLKAGYNIKETSNETTLSTSTVGAIFAKLKGESKYLARGRRVRCSTNPNGRPKTKYPKELVHKLKKADKQLFLDFYIDDVHKLTIMENNNMTENDFRAFQMRVKRVSDLFTNKQKL